MSRTSRAPLFLLTGVTAAAAFAAIARAVAKRKTAAIDEEVHERTAVRDERPSKRVLEAIAPVGKWWAYVPVAALVAAGVATADDEDRSRRSRIAGTVSIVTAAAGAAILNECFEDLLPQPPAPPGRPSPNHPVFPSGHAFGTATVAITATYVLGREAIASPWIAAPLAATFPIVTAVARIMEEKHWITDICGGYLAAVAVSSLPLAIYEITRGEARCEKRNVER